MKVSSASASLLLVVSASNHKAVTAAKPSLRATATAAEGVLGVCLTGCHDGEYAGAWWDYTCTCDTDVSAGDSYSVYVRAVPFAHTAPHTVFFAQWSGDCCDNYSGQCTQGMTELCDSSNLVTRSFSTNELLDENGDYQGPITLGTSADHNLPVNIQGVFWLQDQATGSSLISMATSRDGRGLSVWNDNSDIHISVRIGGDRVWSYGSIPGGPLSFLQPLAIADLVYHFHGTPKEDPTHFNVVPEAFGMAPGIVQESFMRFEMNLIEPGTNEHYYPATDDRPAAVMWDRPSMMFGIDLESKRYQVAQVINGEGKPTSAYDAFVAYNQGEEDWQDGTIWYQEVGTEDL